MDLEYLHRNGMIPDKFYYQLNEKTATENYIEQRQKEQQLHKEDLLRQYAQEEIDKKLEAAVYDALQNILGGFTEILK